MKAPLSAAALAAGVTWAFASGAQEAPPAPPPPPPLAEPMPSPPPPQMIVVLPPPEPVLLQQAPPGMFETRPSPVMRPAAPFVPVSQPTVRIEAGATFSHIYDVPISGGDVTIAYGKEYRKVAVYCDLTFFGGVQQTGLSAFHVRTTGEVAGKFGVFRLGAGISAGELVLARATTEEDTAAPTFGGTLFTSVDLVSWRSGPAAAPQLHALYVDAKIRSEVAFGIDASPLFWGWSLGAGLRY